ncbi:MAG: bacterial transcriptional activator domain-containing protein [Chloroflexi bacterium]|nr:bacterial transcriptional activator domain-containing protein [Chloroflexota bacterium]
MMATEIISAWQRLFSRDATSDRQDTPPAAIRHDDPLCEDRRRQACRDRAQFHLGRARRAKDHGQYESAIREIERALRYDDTSEAFYQVLAQCYLKRPAADARAAWQALQRAFSLNPRNSYTIDLLLQCCRQTGDCQQAGWVLRAALAAGARREYWEPVLQHLARSTEWLAHIA